MNKILSWVALAALATCAAAPARADTIVYSSSTASGVGNAPDANWSSNVAINQSPNGTLFIGGTQAGGAYGLGNYQDSDGAGLVLTALPAYSGGTISFDFYAIGSWEGNGEAGTGNGADGGDGAPDYFNAYMNAHSINGINGKINFGGGLSLISSTFANPITTSTQDYPSAGSAAGTGAASHGDLGYGTQTNPDQRYHLSFNFGPGSAGDMRFNFWKDGQGREAISDESFGLNNVVVSLDQAAVVPTPSALPGGAVLLGSLVAGTAIRRFKQV